MIKKCKSLQNKGNPLSTVAIIKSAQDVDSWALIFEIAAIPIEFCKEGITFHYHYQMHSYQAVNTIYNAGCLQHLFIDIFMKSNPQGFAKIQKFCQVLYF